MAWVTRGNLPHAWSALLDDCLSMHTCPLTIYDHAVNRGRKHQEPYHHTTIAVTAKIPGTEHLAVVKRCTLTYHNGICKANFNQSIGRPAVS